MKAIAIATLFFLFQISLCSASESELFDIPAQEIEKELESLSELEAFIESHPTETISTISENAQFSNLATKINPLGINRLKATHGEGTFLPFVAGFCCGVPGIALVFFSSDKDERKTQAAITGGLVVFALGIIFFLIGASAA